MIIKRDQAFRVVCCFYTDGIVGTGFFIVKNNMPYLVTATHVAKETNTQTIVILSDEKNNPIQIKLTNFNSSLNWKSHQIADISILPINVSTGYINSILTERCLDFSIFNLECISPSRDTELTTFGFPLGLGVKKYFSPLTFRSFAASSLFTFPRGDDENILCDFFCLENPSCGGYSGGIVMDLSYYEKNNLTMVGSGSKCYGVIHGTISDETGGKLAIVTPSFYLKDLF